MSDNTYTCPVLEIHTWTKYTSKVSVPDVYKIQGVTVGRIQTKQDIVNRPPGSSLGSHQYKVDLEEKIIIIPVESILSIKYSSELKKEETESRHIRRNIPSSSIKYSCCEKFRRCCQRTFCCRRDSKKQIYAKSEQIITTNSNQKAERKILITLEYARYSNIDTPSHLRVTSTAFQTNFYDQHFHVDSLEFYLLDNNEFEKTDFDLKRMQGSILCCLVTQLKAMIGRYPDEETLEEIINTHDYFEAGDPPTEKFARSMLVDGNTSAWENSILSLVNGNRF